MDRKVYKRRYLAPRGSRARIINTGRIEPSFSLSLLLNVKKACPFFINIRKQSNTEEDYLEFILQAAEAGYIAANDIVVCDNASVHFGSNWRLVKSVFEKVGASVVFLPAYSPELNPCELVFRDVKKEVYSESMEGRVQGLQNKVKMALSKISARRVFWYYYVCTQIYHRYK